MEGRLPGMAGALWFRDVGPRGTAEAPVPTLIMPGAANDADLEVLAVPGRRVVFYDTAGRGRSEPVAPRRLRFADQVADLAAVRAGLGIDRCGVLGWSLWAGVAALDAAAHPDGVSCLVVVAPVGLHLGAGGGSVEAPPGVLAHLDQLRAEGVDRDDPEAFCEAWRAAYLPLQLADPAAAVAVRSRPCRHPNEWPDRVTATLAHLLVDLGRYDWRGELGGLGVPTLVVHGTADAGNRAAAEEWAATLPVARLLRLDGVGRLPWLEAPTALAAAVGDMLEDRWPEGAEIVIP